MHQDHPSMLGRVAPTRRRRYAVVTTYPPTPCGVATFSAALVAGLEACGADVDVVHLAADGTGGATPTAARTFSDADVVIVQHEYGIYAGADGDSVLEVLDALVCPSVLVAHTVLERPTANQRSVLARAARSADAVVVMTAAGQERLTRGYDVDPRKVTVIPHGAAVAPLDADEDRWGPGPLLTWGLLGPGKGIEWAIEALSLLRDVLPRPEYIIAGDTHPKVAAHEGEAYRELLIERAIDLGVAGQVRFDPGYRSLAALSHLLRAASVVVLPYDSPDQVTSGVLVDAIAAGRPVIATAFPHAVELLGTGAGIVVDRQDPRALAAAMRRVLTEPDLIRTMSEEARRLAPSLAWSAVADRYDRLADGLLAIPTAVPA